MAQRSTGLWSYRRPVGGGGTPPPPPFVFVAPPLLPPVEYVLYVADRTGTVIGELVGALGAVTWSSDGYGMSSLALSPASAARYGSLLDFGRRAQIEFSGGLAPWGGFIDVPRETTRGLVTAHLYEAGYALNWLLTGPQDLYLESEARPAAEILADLVRRSGMDIGLDVTLAGGGPPVEAEFHYETLAAAAEKLRGLDAALHYYTRPRHTTGQRIDFDLVLFRDTGAAGGGAVLVPGWNLADWTTLEQGPIYNEVMVGIGDFLTVLQRPGDAVNRHELGIAIDPASQQRYGRRQQPPIVLTEAEAGPGRAEARARAALEVASTPRGRVQGTCLNLPPGPFSDLRVGTRVTVEASPSVLEASLLVLGMEFRPSAGTLSLVFAGDAGGG